MKAVGGNSFSKLYIYTPFVIMYSPAAHGGRPLPMGWVYWLKCMRWRCLLEGDMVRYHAKYEVNRSNGSAFLGLWHTDGQFLGNIYGFWREKSLSKEMLLWINFWMSFIFSESEQRVMEEPGAHRNKSPKILMSFWRLIWGAYGL